MKNRFGVLMVLASLSGPVQAEVRTATLSVPSMTCVTCPLTVKVALQQVDGVIDAKVTWEPKEAVVTYDDAKTDVEALIRATTNVGYPSVIKQ